MFKSATRTISSTDFLNWRRLVREITQTDFPADLPICSMLGLSFRDLNAGDSDDSRQILLRLYEPLCLREDVHVEFMQAHPTDYDAELQLTFQELIEELDP
jgi:hypothetical protein